MFLAALGVSALAIAPLWLAAGCAAGSDNPGTTRPTGGGGTAGSGGSGGSAGSAGSGGGAGATGSGGSGGSTGSGGSGGSTGGSGGGGGSACVPEPEVCDGKDNNCDGVTDEDCLCKLGDTQACYTGDPEKLGIGECVGGTSTCDITGTWGPCEGEVVPAAEACDDKDNDCNGTKDDGLGSTTCGVGACQASVDNCVAGVPGTCTPGLPVPEKCNGMDDNCDGVVDEGCVCLDGTQQSCYTGPPTTLGVGECLGGTQHCQGGQWGPCQNEIVPAVETCNAKDDDCDGNVDEGLGTSVCGLGTCQVVAPNCEGGIPQTCVPGLPGTEVCDGKDNDCNGTADDGLGTITCGIGACLNTVPFCQNGLPNVCNALPPQAEVCDGIDNNCNGAIDDGNPGGGGACNTGLSGVCAAGTLSCTGGSLQCVQNLQPSAEICDGNDNDCNGTADDGNPGSGSPCTTGLLGSCAAGTTTCVNGAITCAQNAQPSSETCDGFDNNCNGGIDEGNPGGGAACNTGQLGACAAGTTACVSGSIVCNQSAPATAETCDGIDNNCNGSVDEGNPGGGLSCTTGLSGLCAAGTTACSNGTTVCNQNAQPAVETCNGLDDDCNGTVDNGNPGGGLACTTGQLGVCSPGTTQCTGGAIACNRNVNPSAEACDGLDNDCNGLVDEGVKTTYYRDADGDTFGDPGVTVQACSQPAGYVTNNTDCNDGNNAVHPGATEVCNGVDDNCVGGVDEGVKTTYYADSDGDTYGSPSVTTQACSQPAGHVTNGADCNDNNNAVHPGATEVCNGVDDNCSGAPDEGNPGGGLACSTGQLGVCAAGTTLCQGGAIACPRNVNPSVETCDGLDNDCNGAVDDGVKTTYYRDADGDTYGDPSVTTQACSQPAGYVTSNADCNDASGAVHPGATEVCNGIDDNCVGGVDEGVKTTYYRDADGDTYGSPSVTTQACSQPAGYVTGNTDCNDASGAVHPGATEVCNGIDDNCNGGIDDGNPGGGVACGACGLGTTLCSGGAVTCTNANLGVSTYYRDADGDTYGNPNFTTQACSAPSGYVAVNTDCNDSSGAVHPGALEVCNGIDDNCNGSIDEGVKTTYYRDADGDTYGNPNFTTQACSAPSGYVAGNTDCNDSNGAVHPGATELCDGLDNNCDSIIDNGNPGGGFGCTTGLPGACAAGTTACTGGALVCNQNTAASAEVCDGADNNCDGQVDNNAVIADSLPNSCASAANRTVAVLPGGTGDITGYIDPNGDDWFVVNFTGVPGAGGYYHPRIRFISNPSTQFKLRVYSSCGNVAAGCTGNLDTFEMSYPDNPNGCNFTYGSFTCTDFTPKVTSLIVQVTRVAGAPFTCTPYTVRADNL